MKKNILIFMCCLFAIPIQGAIETIFHSKVIQSNLPPATSERPANFQQYLGLFDYSEYEFNRRSYYVLFGYPNNKRNDAITVLDKLDEFSDQIVVPW